MSYKEVNGDLIELALLGSFDVIAHGCNCFNLQGAGIAKQMDKIFNTTSFKLDDLKYKGDFNKLGQINFIYLNLHRYEWSPKKDLAVVNAYTQYHPGPNLDYEALILCLRKINHEFKGKHIGLPQIGCGIAGGIWDIDKFAMQDEASFRKSIELKQQGFKDVKTIMQQELKDCDVTVVIYNK